MRVLRDYRISATEALIIKFLKELSFELNILSNQTGQVKVEIDELVAQKENVYKFTLQNIEGTRAAKTQSFSNAKSSRKNAEKSRLMHGKVKF